MIQLVSQPIEGFQSDNGDLNATMCIKGMAALVGSADNCKRRFQQYLEDGDKTLRIYNIKHTRCKECNSNEL